MNERRKDLRVACRLEIEADTGNNWFMIHSNNISLHGIMLVTESGINKLSRLGIACNKKVKLSFYLTDKTDLAKVNGQIIRIGRGKDPDSNKAILCIGIEFLEMGERAKKQLELFIYSKNKTPSL